MLISYINTFFYKLSIILQSVNEFNTKIIKINLLMDEIRAVSIALSIASLGIFVIFFYSNDDDDHDGGLLVKATQKIH